MRIRWRNFELPSKVTPDSETLTPEYGRFLIEPFERGFGHTIGNGLRRVLLSSIEGTAVTAVRIEGTEHEFASLEGVYEDVTDVILDIKRLRIRHPGTERITCRIKKSGKGPVTGADVECPGDTVVVNRDLAGIDVDQIYTDNFQGGYLATQHLLSLGHRRIACIAGPSDLTLGACSLTARMWSPSKDAPSTGCASASVSSSREERSSIRSPCWRTCCSRSGNAAGFPHRTSCRARARPSPRWVSPRWDTSTLPRSPGACASASPSPERW